MTEIDPDQFIITRKRKKYKFAKFANARNCFEFDEWQWQTTQRQGNSTCAGPGLAQTGVDIGEGAPGLARRRVDVVEIGAGTGLFVVELAARHPELVFAAVDVKADRLQKGAYEALEKGIDNVVFIRARADQIDELFTPGSLRAIWLTFSDPFPKKRSAGRRLTHSTYLKKYATILCSRSNLEQNLRSDIGSTRLDLEQGGQNGLYIKHDNLEFFQWSLEQLVAEGWRIDELSFDLHESELSDDYKALTSYEQRWLEEGRTTQFVRAH